MAKPRCPGKARSAGDSRSMLSGLGRVAISAPNSLPPQPARRRVNIGRTQMIFVVVTRAPFEANWALALKRGSGASGFGALGEGGHQGEVAAAGFFAAKGEQQVVAAHGADVGGFDLSVGDAGFKQLSAVL